MIKAKPSSLTEWLNTIMLFIGIASMIFIAGRKDEQLTALAKVSTQLVDVSSQQGKSLAEIQIQYVNIKEKVDALYYKK